MKKRSSIQVEEIDKLISYIDQNGMYKGGHSYSRETKSKSVRFYLAYYMKSTLGMNYREIAEAFKVLKQNGEGDHSSAINWIRKWGNLCHHNDIQTITEEIRFIFPIDGKSKFEPDLATRIMHSLHSISKEVYRMRVDELIDSKTVAELIGSDGPSNAIKKLQKLGVNPRKIVNHNLFFSREEVMNYV